MNSFHSLRKALAHLLLARELLLLSLALFLLGNADGPGEKERERRVLGGRHCIQFSNEEWERRGT